MKSRGLHRTILQACLSKVGLRQVRIAWQDVRLHLRQTIECLLAQAEMVFDDLLGCQA